MSIISLTPLLVLYRYI